MATVTTNIQFQTNDNAWFIANASLVLLDGESAYHVDGRYKFGDGVTVLSALSFLGAGGGGGSQDLQSVTDLGSVTTNNIEANSFVKTGGVSTEFLKGDGTVDTNTYLTTESQTLQNVTDAGNTTTNDIQFDTGVGVLLDNTSRLREGTIDAGYGGAKGISQICAVGYELKWESGSLYVMDSNGTHIRHTLYNFSSVPSITEDITKGFLVGTRWSLDNGDSYVCTDNSVGAAVWVLQSNGIPTLAQVLASGSTTGGNSIQSNGFLSYLDINDAYIDLLVAGGSTELYMDAVSVALTTVTSIALDAPSLTKNGVEVATVNDLASLVPYTGANADVNLGEFGVQLGNLEFDTTPTNVPTGAGSMAWNDTDGTLDLKLKGGNVTLQVGQEQVIRVVNKTATNITLLEANYQAVRITGTQGQRLKVDLALATTDLLSAETIGLVTETIANNQEGFVTTSGLVRGVNTTGSLQSETWADGDILYLSPTTSGNITNIKPTAPNHLLTMGYVVHSHITQGTIFVKVDNGYELNELHNVLINGVANNDVLTYESSTSLWKNKTVGGNSTLDNLIVSGNYMPTKMGYAAVSHTGGINGSLISKKMSGRKTCTITSLSVWCLTGVAGGNVRLAVYSDLNGLPRTLLADTGNIACTTSGLKEGTITPLTLLSGTTYHICLQVSSTTISLKYNLNEETNYYDPTNFVYVFTVSATFAFAAFPTTFPTVAYQSGAGFNEVIYLKAQ